MQRIDLSTFRELLDHAHELACYCPGCGRWAACDLAALVRAGLGDKPIRFKRPRCRKYGLVGRWQVRAPVPSFDGFEQYGTQ